MAKILSALGLCTAFALAACGNSEGVSATDLECTRLNIMIDGEPVFGIEDLAVYGETQLILSAYDRSNPDKTPKGLFLLDVGQASRTIAAKRLTKASDPLIPHGFTLNADKTALFVIDRSTTPARIVQYALDGETATLANTVLDTYTWSPGSPYPCNLNDLTFIANNLLAATNDRASCGTFGKTLDNLFGRRNGSIIIKTLEGEAGVLVEGLYFPNGISSYGEDSFLYAATRSKQINTQDGAVLAALPGAPDNITRIGDTNSFWVAVLPSLPKLLLYRLGIHTEGGSLVGFVGDDVQIYKVDNFRAATVVAEVGSHLYLGSAYDSGLARCGRPDV